MDKLAEDQLVQCIIDLSKRFSELGDEGTSACLLVLAGTIKEGSQATLSLWMMEYAKFRIDAIQKQLGEDS